MTSRARTHLALRTRFCRIECTHSRWQFAPTRGLLSGAVHLLGRPAGVRGSRCTNGSRAARTGRAWPGSTLSFVVSLMIEQQVIQRGAASCLAGRTVMHRLIRDRTCDGCVWLASASPQRAPAQQTGCQVRTRRAGTRLSERSPEADPRCGVAGEDCDRRWPLRDRSRAGCGMA
jgi:hypothetical protein